jgi:hypothetical protein
LFSLEALHRQLAKAVVDCGTKEAAAAIFVIAAAAIITCRYRGAAALPALLIFILEGVDADAGKYYGLFW